MAVLPSEVRGFVSVTRSAPQPPPYPLNPPQQAANGNSSASSNASGLGAKDFFVPNDDNPWMAYSHAVNNSPRSRPARSMVLYGSVMTAARIKGGLQNLQPPTNNPQPTAMRIR